MGKRKNSSADSVGFISGCMTRIKRLIFYTLFGCFAFTLAVAAFGSVLPDRGSAAPANSIANNATDQRVTSTPWSTVRPTTAPTEAPTETEQPASTEQESLAQAYERGDEIARALERLEVLENVITALAQEQGDGSFEVLIEMSVREGFINDSLADQALILVSDALAPATVSTFSLIVNDGAQVNDFVYEGGDWRTTEAPAAPTATITETPTVTASTTITDTPQSTRTPRPTNTATQAASIERLYVSASVANVRSCPRTSCDIVTTVSRGDLLEVVERVQGDSVGNNTNWAAYDYQGQAVYVHSSLLTRQEPGFVAPTSSLAGGGSQNRSTAVPVQSTPDNSPRYTCNCSKTCGEMSCQEAYFQLNECGCSRRDGDNDGIPCESQCGG